MTHRERFYAAVTHQPVDRAVFDILGSPQTQIDSPAVKSEAAKLLGETHENPENLGTEEFILRCLDVDTRLCGGMPTPPTSHNRTENGIEYDSYGIGYRRVKEHMEICSNPLKDKTLDEVMAYELPDADNIDLSLIETWAEKAKYLHENTDYAVIAEHPVLGVFEIGCWMFGFDDYLYRLAAEPETVHAFSERILQYQKKVIEKYYGALGKYIDATTSGDDFGTQKAPFCSLNMFNELIKPYLKERVSYTKKFTDAFYKHHTCGSVFPLIPSIIDCGVDILNPIQPGVYQMEPERLKEAYGSEIAFWGGIDTQDLLVNQPIEQIYAEVKRVCGIFGRDGGYILSPAHCIQPDVSAQKLLAVYEAAHEYYGC